MSCSSSSANAEEEPYPPLPTDVYFSSSASGGMTLNFNDFKYNNSAVSSFQGSSSIGSLFSGSFTNLSLSISSSTSQYGYYTLGNFGIGQFFSNADNYEAHRIDFGSGGITGALGYSPVDSYASSFWLRNTGYTAANSGRFNLRYGVTYQCQYALSNRAFVFRIYCSSPVSISSLVFWRCVPLADGALVAGAGSQFSHFDRIPCVPYSPTSPTSNTLMSLEFYDQNRTMIMNIIYPSYVVRYEDDALFYSPNGMVRYSSYSVTDSSSYNEAYNSGYADGNKYGQQLGYDNGYSAGNEAGSASGYSAGYAEGVAASNTYSFSALIGSVIDVPLHVFKSMFDFEVFGVNLTTFFLSLLTVCIIIKLVSLLSAG